MNNPLNRNYDYLVSEDDTAFKKTKHSKSGVISFILSIIVLIGFGTLYYLMANYSETGVLFIEKPIPFIGKGISLLIFIGIISIIFGIIGTIQTTCKRIFAVLGLIFSLSILSIIILFSISIKQLGIM